MNNKKIITALRKETFRAQPKQMLCAQNVSKMFIVNYAF